MTQDSNGQRKIAVVSWSDGNRKGKKKFKGREPEISQKAAAYADAIRSSGCNEVKIKIKPI